MRPGSLGSVPGPDDIDVHALARHVRLAVTDDAAAAHREALRSHAAHLEVLAHVVLPAPSDPPRDDPPDRARDDIPGPCLPHAEVLAATPAKRGPWLAAPGAK